MVNELKDQILILKQERINELQDVKRQLHNTGESLRTMIIKTDTMFAEGYNAGLEYAQRLINLDRLIIETKIKLIENETI